MKLWRSWCVIAKSFNQFRQEFKLIDVQIFDIDIFIFLS